MSRPVSQTLLFALGGANVALLACVAAFAIGWLPMRTANVTDAGSRDRYSQPSLPRPSSTNPAMASPAPREDAAPRDNPDRERLAAGRTPEPFPANTSIRPDLAEQERATIDLFRSASPSVVHITTAREVRSIFRMDAQKVAQGSGTGFVWDDAGHIVTNYHVIKDADQAMVAFDDQNTYAAKLIGTAEDKDLAVLKVDAPPEQLRPLRIGTSSDLDVGRMTFAIGNPFGLDQTLTTGVVSALGREIKSVSGVPIKDVIQTDAAINPGNSGGPLLNLSGQLVGVNTAIYSPSGAYAGIGFAIPVDTVRWVVPELIQHGRIIRPDIAIVVAPDTVMRQLRLPTGVLIVGVGEGSAAEKAGLQAAYRTNRGIVIGDIIIALDQKPIESTVDLRVALEDHEVGDVVRLTVIRDNRKVLVPVELELLDG